MSQQRPRVHNPYAGGPPQPGIVQSPLATHTQQRAPAPRYGGLLGGGIAAIVFGSLVLLIGGGALLLIAFMFLLGGGGNVDAFREETFGMSLFGWITSFTGFAILATGIVLLVVRARKRKRASA
ncbi:hypothetical protein [uncultured Agrococcus sp.]|uniref:hypothetical protein n=1 Tax=uncultured Agrococcus sp. TaxID=382258 RepID=UPI0025F02593|nr:hypothetical protein [uncultured Agrococcus sp.]